MAKRKRRVFPVQFDLDPLPPGGVRRVTMSLPGQLAVDLAAIARRLNITTSALVAQLLVEPVADLRKLIELVPEDAESLSAEQTRRLRGASADLIAQRVADAIREVGGKGDA